MRALLVAGVLFTSCIAPGPLARPSPGPDASPSPTPSTWAYDGTLLQPRDADTYENVLLDAKPLSDGGWVVLRAVEPRRYLVDPTSYGPLIKRPYGELLKLDATG